jgi:pimeloyl-ACP methyl ester carboxylesterase
MRVPASNARRIIALAFGLALAASSWPAGAGGVPEVPDRVPQDWLSVGRLAESDVVRALAAIPHDPNPLGVRAAHLRTKRYPPIFQPTRFSAADGTPLAGMRAVWDDGRARPGVVVVPGLALTKDHKFVVEVAEVLSRNGWHVLTIDPRGHGDSRRLSSAMITAGWKETEDVLGAARYLRERTSSTSIAVVGFSLGGRSLVKAMAKDEGGLIAAGIAVSAPLAAGPPLKTRDPRVAPTPFAKFLLEFLGAPSFHEYYSRAAASYGVDLRTMEAQMTADAEIALVRKPLLMLHALDDFQLLLQLKLGRHDGGTLSLAYRDTVRNHPHVRTLVLDRGNHGGELYLSDPHWFALTMLTYLKHWQARDVDHVTAAAPPLDVLAEGQLEGQTTTYRVAVRNHGPGAVSLVDVHVQIPPDARLEHCSLASVGLARCAQDGRRLSWTLPRLPGQKTLAGPFVAVVDVSRVKKGPFETRVWVTTADGSLSLAEEHSVVVPQHVTRHKP